jgi:signal transduction histidine kinase
MRHAPGMPVPGTLLFDRLLALGVVGLAALVAALRDAPSLGRDVLLLAVAVSPWLVQAVRPLALPTSLRAAPVLVAVAVLLADGLSHEPSPLLLLILVVCTGWEARLRESLAINVAACAVVVAAAVSLRHVEEAFIWCVGLTLGWAFGHSSRCQAEAMRRLEAAQATLAAQAVSDERRRVAREVHDVIAHTLAVTMLHLTGARLALADGDSDEALRGLQDAERLGRESLAGLRRSVGLLTGAESATAPPVPTAADVAALVTQYRAAGATVDLACTGDPCVLPDDVGLVVYRVTQESLANAVRHAPGARVTVELDARDPVRLCVTDDGGGGSAPAGPGTGVGVPGMRERAALVGGVLDAGPHGAGWRVELVVPVRPGAPEPTGEQLPAAHAPA